MRRQRGAGFDPFRSGRVMAHRGSSSCLAGEAPSASAYERRFGSDQLEQKRAREQPKRCTGEETVRGPREERGWARQSVFGMSWVRHWVFRLPANLVLFARGTRDMKTTERCQLTN